MRERIAMLVATAGVCFAILVSATFAWKHNRGGSGARPALVSEASGTARMVTETPQPERKPAPPGRLIFESQHCGTCHSIHGVGNPRYPLDGVGARLERSELREAIEGAGARGSKMPKAIRQKKAGYAKLSHKEMTTLIDYLATLVEERKGDLPAR